jgi:hypothetical protein
MQCGQQPVRRHSKYSGKFGVTSSVQLWCNANATPASDTKKGATTPPFSSEYETSDAGLKPDR